MRFDYLAVWDDPPGMDEGEIDHIRRATGLDQIRRAGGLTVFANMDDTVLVGDDGLSIVLGVVFEGFSPARRCSSLSRQLWEALPGSGGSALAQHWGAYISLVVDEAGAQLRVFRDPSGQQACFYRHSAGKLVLSSRADLLQKAIDDPLLPDPNVLLDHILWPAIRPEQTALSDVMELLPGHELRAGQAGLACRMEWSPWFFAANAGRAHTDARALADALRDRVVGCVDAWASQAGRTLLAVSGGLDSSIVAAALVQSRRDTLCVTLATDDMAGDERVFARILAKHLALDLVEEREVLEAVDLARSDAGHLPRPVARAFAQSGDAVQQALARDRGIDLFMTGGGGDNVFCYLHSAAPVADHLIAAGIGAGALRTARDVSALTGVGLTTVLRRARTKKRMAGMPYPWPMRTEFVPVERVAPRTPPAHPWLAPPADMPPGKVMHVAWLLAIQNHLEGYGREALHPMRAPLMSQPILEFCLEVPSWEWCRDGQDRALARRAFAPMLPPEIHGRRSKGTPTSFVMQLVEERRGEIRALLLDGWLASQRLIDSPALEAFLQSPDPRQVNHYMQAMAFVDVESWARAWIDPAIERTRKG